MSTIVTPGGDGQPAAGPQDDAPTWRDLPAEPPYGPVRPSRTAHIGPAFPVEEVPEDTSAISPGQIAMAIGGTLLLVAIGIGAALLLLRDDTAVATVDDPQTSAPADEQPFDGPAPPTEQPAPQPPQGQLEPQPAPALPELPQPDSDQTDPGQTDPGQTDPGQTDPGQTDPGQTDPGATDPGATDPGQTDPEQAVTEDGVDLPRIFVLRTLPSSMEELSTTIRHTTRDDEVVLEQTTLLDGPDGEVTVRATRADDAVARHDAMVDDQAEELSVQGFPAYLLEPGHLVWLLPSTPETLMEIVGPASTRTDQLLTLGNGLELVR